MSQDGVIRVQCLQFTRSSVATVSIFRCLHYFRYRPLDRWRHNGHVVVCGSWCRVPESGCRGAIVKPPDTSWHNLPPVTSYLLYNDGQISPVYHKQFAGSEYEASKRSAPGPGCQQCACPLLCWWYLSSRWRPGKGPAFHLFVSLGTFSNSAVND